MKLLLGTVVGVFIGAFATELLRHKHPELVARVERKARDFANGLLWEIDDDGGVPALAKGPIIDVQASSAPAE